MVSAAFIYFFTYATPSCCSSSFLWPRTLYNMPDGTDKVMGRCMHAAAWNGQWVVDEGFLNHEIGGSTNPTAL